jgi:hypothetical protein
MLSINSIKSRNSVGQFRHRDVVLDCYYYVYIGLARNKLLLALISSVSSWTIGPFLRAKCGVSTCHEGFSGIHRVTFSSEAIVAVFHGRQAISSILPPLKFRISVLLHSNASSPREEAPKWSPAEEEMRPGFQCQPLHLHQWKLGVSVT